MVDIYREIIDIKDKGQDAALVTVISTGGSTPRKADAKMLVKPDGSTIGTIGGGNLELLSTREALAVIRTGKTRRLDYSLADDGNTGMICGGNTEVFIEPILAEPSLFICGGGHIGRVLAQMGKLLDFRIIIIDDRPDFASQDRFPEADLCLVSDYANAFQKLKVDRPGYIVIVTHGHDGDEAALIGALGTPARYIGMIGSRKKVAVNFAHLRERGFSPEQIGRVHAPIGLTIHAQTPAEIAISILAEIIAIRRSPEEQPAMRDGRTEMKQDAGSSPPLEKPLVS